MDKGDLSKISASNRADTVCSWTQVAQIVQTRHADRKYSLFACIWVGYVTR
jgi:hypothetical protein